MLHSTNTSSRCIYRIRQQNFTNGSHSEELKAAEEARNASSADRPYSRAVLLESLRLWPTTPAILRETTRDADLGGKTIPKGTPVVIFAPFFHRDDERLDFAHKLSPERWLDRDVDVDNGLLPFSAGHGMCPAHNLVPLVASLAIDEIVKRAWWSWFSQSWSRGV
ncbi:cytochrome P450 [Triangularia verruculosa]|uniref:Cytochrome P450 n=1 Tax=Triangularia verruculosa TaxID=2587418 RepID=A0AAN7AVW2_9PEZI|nr:cytochrome P450 [Triangularia verruculosa]